MNKTVLIKIKKELRKKADKNYNASAGYKKKIKTYQVRVPVVRKISAKYFRQIKHLDKKKIFALCEKLLQSGYQEDSVIAFDWAWRLKNQYSQQDFKIFKKWLKNYVNNWAKCDDLCTHALGYFLLQFPQFIQQTHKWSKANNKWLRRASAVSLIYSVRRKKHFNQVLKIAQSLLTDKQNLVQKAYGWALKEASKNYQKQIFDFVIKRKNKMPRVALRYAIEKMPDKLKQKAMA